MNYIIKTSLIYFMKYLLFAATAILFLGCQKGKDDNDLINSTTTCKLKTITYNFSPSPRVYNVVYSGDNILELSSSVDKTQYTYNATGQLTKKETLNNGNTQAQYKTEFSYNGDGFLAEEKNYEFFGGSLQATSRYTFQYNGSRLSQMNHYTSGGTTYNGKTVYTWTGDNITSIDYYDETNTLECTTIFTYDLTKENSFYSKFKVFYLQDLYDDDFAPIYFISKNQLTSSSNQCAPVETDNWAYTYNSENLTKTVTINGSSIPMWTFGYTCD
ncbi:MAG: hypothetical protein WDO19_20095 [Bacteroidota bacterium]